MPDEAEAIRSQSLGIAFRRYLSYKAEPAVLYQMLKEVAVTQGLLEDEFDYYLTIDCKGSGKVYYLFHYTSRSHAEAFGTEFLCWSVAFFCQMVRNIKTRKSSKCIC